MDASFEKIEKIVPHDNADSLEIAIVSNFPCVVRKGEFKAGDLCFYIRDDAKLLGFDDMTTEVENLKKGGFLVPENINDLYKTDFDWQRSLIKYLGSGGRVKTIKLRGKTSMGILLKPEVVSSCKMSIYSVIDDDNYEMVNSLIKDSEHGADFLKNNFGITHWEAPIRNFGDMKVKYSHLPDDLKKSDEENWENIDESDLHLGTNCIVTKKYDGSSTTLTCRPDGTYDVSSRSMTFMDETDENKMNAYQKLTKNLINAGLWWAKKHSEVIAFRGESCCGAFNNSSYNKCCTLNRFFLYGCNFPNRKNWFEKNGCYGTNFHFLKIAEELKNNGFNIDCVDVLEKDVPISKELLKKYNDMPYTFGEGVVINVDCSSAKDREVNSTVWHYKSKSREYLMKMK